MADYRNRPPVCNLAPQEAPRADHDLGVFEGGLTGAPIALALWIAIAGGLGAIALIFQ